MIRGFLLVLLGAGGAGTAAAAGEADYILPEAPASSPIVYTADYLQYIGTAEGDNAEVLLKGNVELKGTTWTLRADELTINMVTREARAKGGFELDDGLTVLKGRDGRFDLAGKLGLVSGVRAEYPPWRVWAQGGRINPDKSGSFDRALFTSCEGNPPDYHFRASRLSVTPGKYLTASNVRFHIWKIPIFYSPFMWKSLSNRGLIRTRMIPGYDRRNGAHLRTNTLFNITPRLYGKLFLDYYGAQGPAAGAELDYHPSEDARGALYGYRIKEKASGRERWTVLGSHYSSFGSSYAVQGRLQAQGDPEVNNHYLRANAFRVTTELVNSAAFVRRTPKSVTRLSYSRLDSRDAAGTGFLRSRESLPRLDFTTSQFAVRKIPALFTFNAFGDNGFEAERGFQQKSFGAGLEGTQTKILARGVSLTPKVSVREVFEDRRETAANFGSTRTYRDAFTAFADAGTNIRFDTPIGTWDASYLIGRRFRTGTLQFDDGAPDHGFEANLAGLKNTWRPDRRVLVRVGSGYDFRVFRDRTLGFRRRVSPFAGDIILTPRRGMQLSLSDSYQLAEGNRNFLVQADFGERDENFLGFGLTHSRDRADTYFGATEAGWVPKGSAWRVGGALRQQVKTPGGFDLRGFQVFEKEVSIGRLFHDFDTRALVRFRPGGVKEGFIRVDLRYARTVLRRARRKNWESEWFPWRKNPAADDRD